MSGNWVFSWSQNLRHQKGLIISRCIPSNRLQSLMTLCFTGHVHNKSLRRCREKWIKFHCKNNVVSWKKHRCCRPICSYPRCVSMLQINIITPYTMSIHLTANFNVSALNVPFSCFTSVIPKESLQKICNIVAHKCMEWRWLLYR